MPSATLEAESNRHGGPAVHIPPKNVWLDESSHWLKYGTNSKRCRLPQFNGYIHFKCDIFGVHLCLSKDYNCFKSFHE